jgi:hypothetical protein
MGDDQKLIDNWFGALDEEATISESSEGRWYYFRQMALVPLPPAGQVDQQSTPLVLLQRPQSVLGTIWTGGSVIFTPTPLRSQFPKLDRINRLFGKWLRDFELVFSHQPAAQAHNWDYYLEGGIMNCAKEIFALPEAMNALRRGQYFVRHGINASSLDQLSRQLRLRGVNFEGI